MTQRHVVITATVVPQTKSVKLQDPNVRLRQYLTGLEFLKLQGGIDRVTIVENSGNDFAARASAVLGPIKNDFLCYHESHFEAPIAALEAAMYSHFLSYANELSDTCDIVKLTGRYSILNFTEVFLNKGNLAFSFRPTLGLKRARSVLTSAYQLEMAEFRRWVHFLAERDLSVKPLEMYFAEFISSRKLHSVSIDYPIISGESGTFGTPYANNKKERTRIFLSKVLPFAFYWQSPQEA
jgi:hypothetical protein